jgi:hypothetical protein
MTAAATRPGFDWGAVLNAGVTAAALDFLAACVMFDAKPSGVGHVIASGLIGPEAARAGAAATAALGGFLHLFILLVAAGLWRLAAGQVPVLARRPLLFGPLYGLAIFGFMNFVVLPLSLADSSAPWTLMRLTRGVLVHMLLVGLPLAAIAGRGLRRA